MKRLLISGGEGDFSKEIIKQNTEYKILAPSRDEMDITNIEDIRRIVTEFNPDVFLHPAALTRPMVKHIETPDVSITTNIIGTANVALVCMENNTKLVYISTDYVYPGTSGNYKENDAVLPVNSYAWSKLGGECSVMLYDNSLILRMSMTKKPFVHDKALVDSYKSLMYIDEAATACLKLLDSFGIINVGGPTTNHYDFVVNHEKLNIDKIYRKDISEPMAENSSMDLHKMNGILNEN
jgi:dTDP-4-dehydrorhamnose reductase